MATDDSKSSSSAFPSTIRKSWRDVEAHGFEDNRTKQSSGFDLNKFNYDYNSDLIIIDENSLGNAKGSKRRSRRPSSVVAAAVVHPDPFEYPVRENNELELFEENNVEKR